MGFKKSSSSRGGGLVLDVGSGGKPYPRSDILLDWVTGAAHRCGVAMMIDRPTVFGDASRMPFKGQASDFVVASHILVHMAEPKIFLAQLQRVGKAGYIQPPQRHLRTLAPLTAFIALRRDFDIFSNLACPECKGELQKLSGRVSCPACKVSYPLDPYPDFAQPKMPGDRGCVITRSHPVIFRMYN